MKGNLLHSKTQHREAPTTVRPGAPPLSGDCAAAPTGLSRFIGAARILIAIGLLTALLFAHSCHGDEDTELFGALAEWAQK